MKVNIIILLSSLLIVLSCNSNTVSHYDNKFIVIERKSIKDSIEKFNFIELKRIKEKKDDKFSIKFYSSKCQEKIIIINDLISNESLEIKEHNSQIFKDYCNVGTDIKYSYFLNKLSFYKGQTGMLYALYNFDDYGKLLHKTISFEFYFNLKKFNENNIILKYKFFDIYEYYNINSQLIKTVDNSKEINLDVIKKILNRVQNEDLTKVKEVLLIKNDDSYSAEYYIEGYKKVSIEFTINGDFKRKGVYKIDEISSTSLWKYQRDFAIKNTPPPT